MTTKQREAIKRLASMASPVYELRRYERSHSFGDDEAREIIRLFDRLGVRVTLEPDAPVEETPGLFEVAK